jgi:TolB-like protein
MPADRFPTVAQFKEALLGGPGTGTYVRRSSGYVTSRGLVSPVAAPNRRRAFAVGGVAIALLLAAGTAAAYYRINRGRTSSAGGGAAELRRVAVLYLDDESKDSSFRHVADGLTESLIAQLGQVNGLDVVSAGGVAPYRNTNAPDDSIARALNVGLLVRGSVEPQGDNLKVTVRLIDSQSGADFKRESFRVAAGDFLKARDSLAHSVADVLRERLGEEVRLRELRGGTRSAEAWALVQRVENLKKDADRLANAGDPQAAVHRLMEADSLAARAATLDDNWPEPAVERSSVVYRQARLTKDPKQVATLLEKALGHVERALATDPRDPEALELRGTLKYYRIQSGLVPDQTERNRLISEAEGDLREAVRIAPRQASASAWNALSVLMYGKQNRVESHMAAQRAYEADSYLRAAPDILWRLWATSYDLEDFPDAAQWCAEGQRRFPSNPRFVKCRLYLMITKAVTPDPDSAWRMVSQLEKLTPPQDRDYERRQAQILVAIVLARANLADSAHHVLAASRATVDADPRGDLIALEALARTFFGERNEAIALLQRYVSTHPEHRAGFSTVNAWWWRDLQQDPRFKTLAATGR